jgi:signal transduction histidine kinase
LARELHDTLAHVQSGVAVQLEAVDTLWETNPTHARQILQKSLATVRTGMSETRRALQALRASPLETQTLMTAIQMYATQKAAHSDFELALQLPDELDELNDEVEQAIYRIVQESLTNIENHAQAQNVLITLAKNKGILELCIRDDGRGFVLDKIDPRTSFGIRGMEEWADMIHGTLRVQSTLGQGTEIKLRVATN